MTEERQPAASEAPPTDPPAASPDVAFEASGQAPDRVPRADDADVGDEGLVARTEHLADKYIDRLKHDVSLDEVRESARSFADLFRSIHSTYLYLTLAVYGLAAVGGTVLVAGSAADDWFMHGAMYVVLFAFLMIYIKAHLLRRRWMRGIFALSTAALLGFFGWVLLDLVAPRLVVVEGSAVLREELPLLAAVAGALGLVAVALLFHWLLLARFVHPEEQPAA